MSDSVDCVSDSSLSTLQGADSSQVEDWVNFPIVKTRKLRLRVGQEATLPKASASISQSTVSLGHWAETELMSVKGK